MFCKSRSLLYKYYGKLEWTKEVENFFIESRIFTLSREYFCWVENIFAESRTISSCLILTTSRRFFSGVEIFLLNRNFFIESRIPNMSCRHLPPKWSNNMPVCRSVAYVAFLWIVVVLQIADGPVEDLERFLLSIQDCISHIERCTAPGNDRNMEYIHDSLEGFVEIIHHVRQECQYFP